MHAAFLMSLGFSLFAAQHLPKDEVCAEALSRVALLSAIARRYSSHPMLLFGVSLRARVRRRLIAND